MCEFTTYHNFITFYPFLTYVHVAYASTDPPTHSLIPTLALNDVCVVCLSVCLSICPSLSLSAKVCDTE